MKKLVVLGGGESGTGAAALARKKGYEVLVSDNSKIKDNDKAKLELIGAKWEEGIHSIQEILKADEIVKSPGIPNDSDLIKKIKNERKTIISEIEFASRYTNSKIVAITGSNGKSTTTTLTYHILKQSGLDVEIAGNIGDSFSGKVAKQDHDYFVVEVSSFQLDDIVDFKPYVSVFLNISPDHLDRYEQNFDNYLRAKFRIAENQDGSNYFIYSYDDNIISQSLKKTNINAHQIPFSINQRVDEGGYVDHDKLIIKIKKKQFDMFIYDLAIQGRHNLYNSMAAAITANLFDLRKDVIRESMKNFKSLEHRLEFVANVQGIEFVNDSKGTNVNSTWFALETMSKPIIWIAGGKDKGNDYSTLSELVKKKVKAIICLGVDNRRLHDAFSKKVDLIVNTTTAVEAVKMAYHLGEKGDVVLLSPACASFDLFENYEDRGRQFKSAVRNL